MSIRPRKSGFSSYRPKSLALLVLNGYQDCMTRKARVSSLDRAPGRGVAGRSQQTWPMVQWPVGTLAVSVVDRAQEYDTRVEDPAIQNMEIMASWDALHHIPARLTADFGQEEAEWHIGGPVWRERKVKEEFARRFPEAPWHQLPADWIPTNGC